MPGERSAVDSPLSAGQCRAARAYLNWSIDRLSDRSQVRASTISLFEREIKDPSGAQIKAIRAALVGGGMVLGCCQAPCVCPGPGLSAGAHEARLTSALPARP